MVFAILCAARLNNDALLVQWVEEVSKLRVAKTIKNMSGREVSVYRTFYNDYMEISLTAMANWLLGKKRNFGKTLKGNISFGSFICEWSEKNSKV